MCDNLLAEFPDANDLAVEEKNPNSLGSTSTSPDETMPDGHNTTSEFPTNNFALIHDQECKKGTTFSDISLNSKKRKESHQEFIENEDNASATEQTKRQRTLIPQQDSMTKESAPSQSDTLEMNSLWEKQLNDFREFLNSELSVQQKEKLNALHKLANSKPILDTEKPAVILKKLAMQQKINDSAPSPLAGLTPVFGFFSRPVLPEGLQLSQYGSEIGIPFKYYDKSEEDFLFTRHALYQDKKHREKAFSYYEEVQQREQYNEAAKILIILFSHAIKQYWIQFNAGNKNFPALTTFISEELTRQGFPPLKEKTISEILQFVRYLDNLKSELPSDYSLPIKEESKIPVALLPEITGTETEQNENNKKRIWLKKSKTVYEKNKLLDAKPDTLILGKEDIEIYDEDSGCLIAAIRKKRIPAELIETVNHHVYDTTTMNLANGARGSYVNEHHSVSKKTRSNIRALPIGFLGQARFGICLTTSLKNHPHNTVLIEVTSKLVVEMERVYEEIAPEEYNYAKQVMVNLIRPFDGSITAAVEYNFDYQTDTHTDDNKFPGKNLGYLTCFYGGNKRYQGGLLLFPNHNFAIDIEQGDVIVADFENNLHGNTPIIPLDDRKELLLHESKAKKSNVNTVPAWRRVSLVAFTRGEYLQLAQANIYPSSDDESDFTENDIAKPKPKKQRNPFSFYVAKAQEKPTDPFAQIEYAEMKAKALGKSFRAKQAFVLRNNVVKENLKEEITESNGMEFG